MTDIQRWKNDGTLRHSTIGQWVKYADHVEAMNAQYERGFDNGERKGQRGMLARCIAAVEAVWENWNGPLSHAQYVDTLRKLGGTDD